MQIASSVGDEPAYGIVRCSSRGDAMVIVVCCPKSIEKVLAVCGGFAGVCEQLLRFCAVILLCFGRDVAVLVEFIGSRCCPGWCFVWDDN